MRAWLQDTFFAAVWVIISPTTTWAFHDGTVESCSGCHVPGEDAAAPSSTCLRCHGPTGGEQSVLTSDGSSFTAGGDFYWLTKTFTWGTQTSLGTSHGHNVAAADHRLQTDERLATAPGGAYPAGTLSCVSCHDPHLAKTASYRMLAGVGYTGARRDAQDAFVFAAPIARADAADWTESDDSHPAYGAGMSEWCGNCHRALITGHGQHLHPSGATATLNTTVSATYNSYRATADGRGDESTSYLALVPFEVGTRDPAALDPHSARGPHPGGNATVMCLTCHRAHASAFPSAARWDFSATLITQSHPQATDQGVAGNDVANSYYGRNLATEFGPYQRQLCNKCHGLD